MVFQSLDCNGSTRKRVRFGSTVSVNGIVKQGTAYDVIRKQMEILEPDLVVMGKYGQTEKEEKLLGSVIKRVIQDADCDVLVVD
jgi:nucleotide-binding universal stress UspA family protein